MKWKSMLDFTDDVRGIVIGGDDELTRYTFYTTVPPGVETYLGDGLFCSDAEAETYCKTEWPDAYARGIEMRAYDCRRQLNHTPACPQASPEAPGATEAPDQTSVTTQPERL